MPINSLASFFTWPIYINRWDFLSYSTMALSTVVVPWVRFDIFCYRKFKYHIRYGIEAPITRPPAPEKIIQYVNEGFIDLYKAWRVDFWGWENLSPFDRKQILYPWNSRLYQALPEYRYVRSKPRMVTIENLSLKGQNYNFTRHINVREEIKYQAPKITFESCSEFCAKHQILTDYIVGKRANLRYYEITHLLIPADYDIHLTVIKELLQLY